VRVERRGRPGRHLTCRATQSGARDPEEHGFMPTYDYRCRKCGHQFELFHSMSDDTPRRCPKCRGRAVKVPSGGAGLLFKGSGFYITDYRSAGYQKDAKKESGAKATDS
jgi:putative FmdB family regulatory protein